MKALRFHAAKALRVEDIALPTEPADDEVVIKNRFVGICGTDLHEYAYGPIFVPKNAEGKTAAPQVLGHEYGGTVTKVGKGITHVKVGDRVSVQPFITPRSGDYYSDLGHFNLSDQLQLAGLSWVGGGMATDSLLKGYNVYKVPDGLSDEDAALVEPTAVAVYGVDRRGVKAGDSVLVTVSQLARLLDQDAAPFVVRNLRLSKWGLGVGASVGGVDRGGGRHFS